MGFLNIWGLIALICIPVIIILYMLRPKNIPFTLPSLYLWKVMANEIESASKLQKFKSSLLMVLQIIAVLLLTFMLAGLFRKSGVMPNSVILVIDCSVSMQSTDVSPSRMDEAKKQAEAYINGLEKDAKVTLIAIKDVPEILVTEETDQKLVIATINGLEAVDSYGDMELAIQTGLALKQSEEMEIVYFGDRVYPGATNIWIKQNEDNVGVHGLSYTLYEQAGTISVLADIKNYGTATQVVPLSLYADGLLFDAKQVEIPGSDGAKVFFEGIPAVTSEMKIQIDREDILKVDNTAYAVVGKTTMKKVVLVSASNIYLEKILKLNPGFELFLAEPTAIESLKGYDLYIYDGVLPTKLPEDGAILLFNPPENEFFTVLGHAKNPMVYAANHEITNHIDHPEIAIGLSQIYEVPDWAEEVFYTEYGTAVFAGTRKGVSMAVFGYDLHNTDLPLLVEFPIMMINTLDYLVPTSMLGAKSIHAGDAMQIRIQPSTEQAIIQGPDGNKEALEISQDEVIYKNTNQTGIYQVTQLAQGIEVKESFAVNVPKDQETLVSSEAQEVIQGETTNRKSLSMILGAVAVIIILIEWFIYHKRRKINAVQF